MGVNNCPLAPPGEYDAPICAAAAMWRIATTTVGTCLFVAVITQNVGPGSLMSAAQSTTVHDALLHSTPQTLLVASICGPPAAISCSYRDTRVRCSVFWPFLQPARRPGTRYQTTCEIRHVPLTVFAGT